MCKYRYGENKCAHPKNIALECVGENKCQYVEETDQFSKTGSDGTGLNLDNFDEEVVQEDTCPMTECGLYCKKYNRFYCAGKDNCSSEEDYMQHMKEFGGIDIEKGYADD